MPLKRFYSPLFLVGMVFLLNPVVSLLDVLPNFIGALLIATALTEIAMLDERIENAGRLIFYVAALSGARTVLSLFMFDMDETWILTLVFTLGVAELFAFIYFSVSLFGGIGYMAQRGDCDDGILGEVDRVKRLWVLFFILNVGAAILPELFSLPQQVVRENPDDIPWITERQLILYRNYARLLLSTASLFLGVWWFKVTRDCLKALRGNDRFGGFLQTRYGDFLKANPLQELFLDVRFALICFVTGCVLQFGISNDGNVVLPAWAGTMLIALALLRLGAKRSFVPLVCALLLQVTGTHFVGGGAAEILIAAGSVTAVWAGEGCIAHHVKKTVDLEIDAYFYITKIFYFVFFAIGTVYAFLPNYWLHLARLICFGLWVAVAVWAVSSVIGEIKLRRRL